MKYEIKNGTLVGTPEIATKSVLAPISTPGDGSDLPDGFYWFRSDINQDGVLSVVEISRDKARAERTLGRTGVSERPYVYGISGNSGYPTSMHDATRSGYFVGGPITPVVESLDQQEGRLREVISKGQANNTNNAAARLVAILDAKASGKTNVTA